MGWHELGHCTETPALYRKLTICLRQTPQTTKESNAVSMRCANTCGTQQENAVEALACVPRPLKEVRSVARLKKCCAWVAGRPTVEIELLIGQALHQACAGGLRWQLEASTRTVGFPARNWTGRGDISTCHHDFRPPAGSASAGQCRRHWLAGRRLRRRSRLPQSAGQLP